MLIEYYFQNGGDDESARELEMKNTSNYSPIYFFYTNLLCPVSLDYRNRKSPQIEIRKSRAFTPALSPAKSQGAGGSLKPLLSSHNLMNQHLSSPPQPRDMREPKARS